MRIKKKNIYSGNKSDLWVPLETGCLCVCMCVFMCTVMLFLGMYYSVSMLYLLVYCSRSRKAQPVDGDDKMAGQSRVYFSTNLL